MNDQRRQGRIARRGGCRWLGFTFGLRTGGCLKRGKRAKERERTKAGESYVVRYWRMISCLHSSDPVNSEGEMCTGPIWNNRIPFAIVFLSVSLFLCPTMGTNARISYPPVYACVVTNARARSMRTERRRRRGGDKRAHTFVLVMRYTPMAAGPLYFLPIGTLHSGLYATRAYVFHPRALCYFFDSRGKPRPPTAHGVKEL